MFPAKNNLGKDYLKRLFFALWPEEIVRQRCASLSGKLNAPGILVSETNLHVTLLFLGRISAAQQALVTAEVGKLPVHSMSLTFDRLCFWKKPAVLCLTANQFDQNVSVLNESLTLIARQQGIAVENRPFKPHVTLVKRANSELELDFAPIVWRSNGLCLIESCLGSNGVEYRVIQRWITS
jgi:2'-5' RNA ligase